ncbi:MAG: uracil phosphoribosyltransferase [Actinomycetota bacterium]
MKTSALPTNVTVLDHPLVAVRLTRLRAASTPNAEFRLLVDELSTFLAYEALRDVALKPTLIDTPVVSGVPAFVLAEEPVVIPILRAGLGMTSAVEKALTSSRLCLLGLRRNETTLEPETYHDGIPENLSGTHVVICDPMLATGGSLAHALELVTARGAARVSALCLIGAVPGVQKVAARFPEVHFYLAAVDEELNSNGYIVPGLGDAGDRQFGPPVHNPS